MQPDKCYVFSVHITNTHKKDAFRNIQVGIQLQNHANVTYASSTCRDVISSRNLTKSMSDLFPGKAGFVHVFVRPNESISVRRPI